MLDEKQIKFLLAAAASGSPKARMALDAEADRIAGRQTSIQFFHVTSQGSPIVVNAAQIEHIVLQYVSKSAVPANNYDSACGQIVMVNGTKLEIDWQHDVIRVLDLMGIDPGCAYEREWVEELRKNPKADVEADANFNADVAAQNKPAGGTSADGEEEA